MNTRTRECRRCGGVHRVTPSGHLVAHKCEHGAHCVLSYIARRRGDRVKRCAPCVGGRQLLLFRDYQDATE